MNLVITLWDVRQTKTPERSTGTSRLLQYGPCSARGLQEAGHRCGKEVANIMDDSEKSRPDVVIYRLTESTLFDVRTVVGGDSRYCKQAGQLPGFGAQWGAHENHRPCPG